MHEEQRASRHEPSEQAPGLVVPDLANLDAINNIDTARMALRWALERIHSLQQTQSAQEKTLSEETAARAQSEQDRKDLQRVLELRGHEDSQRSAYYAKLEAYLAQNFAGKLDLPALIKREVQTAELEAMLHDRQFQLEKEYAARREKLEADLQRLKFEAEQSASAQVARAKASVHESRKSLEREFAVKLTELAEKEVRIKAGEASLDQRQQQFEAFAREQRARLELDIKSFKDSMDDQMQYRADSISRFFSSRSDAAAATWNQEKTTLLKEIDEWREKATAYLPRLCELEKQLLDARDSEHQAQYTAQCQG
ncbi:MAG: hypothetical protein WC881_06270, partial [Elusimicrobiota bacterium]